MKQAILITAYKNFDHLVDIISFFDEEFEIYIHIDKKSKIDVKIFENIRAIENVKFLSRKYTVNWGGLNHLKCYLLLAKEALKNPEIKYFHLISGQDFPIKSASQFKKILFNSKMKDYLDFFKMPAKCWLNGGMDRIEYYNFFDFFDAKKSDKWIYKIIKIQKKLNFKRPISNKIPQLYGGSTYWSLTRETLQYVIDYTNENSDLYRRMKYTFCAEEIYFQTVIMNSKYAENVVSDSLRYIDWTSGRGGYPAIIDASDIEKLESSNNLFARKFESPVSDDLKLSLTKNKK